MSYSAFSGFDHIASGTLPEVYASCRHISDSLIFDRDTGRVVAGCFSAATSTT